MIKKINAVISLLRLPNCFLAGFATWVGSYTSGSTQLNISLFYAWLATLLITGAGNATNDIADSPLDREFKPARPIACGELNRTAGWVISILLFALGLGLSWKVSTIHLVISAGVILLLLAYNFFLKRTPLLGNMVIASLSSLPFIFGGLLGSFWNWSLIPFVFAFLFHFAREIIKSMEDREGDARHGIKTIAFYAKPAKLKILILLLFATVSALALVPFILGLYNRIYLAILVPGVFLPEIVVLKFLLSKKLSAEDYPRIHQITKTAMFAGMIAILFAK